MGTTVCDLVLLSWNHLECTRPCVESILAHTQVPSHLIIVDQASEEETRSYLQSLQPSPFVRIEILWNPANVGYPKGMNLGLAKGSAPYVCFLNNDILVPPGWLEEMLRVAESDPTIGAVNPSSNTFNLNPPKGSDWMGFAKNRSKKKDRWIEVEYPEGFCLLGRREILLKVGGFDETTYEQIYFEDADLARKLQTLGLKCVMAEGTYVWHAGGQTMSHRPERLPLFQENERRFFAKWGRVGRQIFYVVADPSEALLMRVGEEARKEVNRFGKVWIFTNSHALLKNLPRHLSIRISSFPRWQLPWMALGMALLKKKKFEFIVTDLSVFRSILKPLRFIHHAEVESL